MLLRLIRPSIQASEFYNYIIYGLQYLYIPIYVVQKNNDHSHNMKHKPSSSGYSSVGGNQFLQNTATNLPNNILLLSIRTILIFFTARTSHLLQSMIIFCPTQIKSSCKSQKNIKLLYFRCHPRDICNKQKTAFHSLCKIMSNP